MPRRRPRGGVVRAMAWERRRGRQRVEADDALHEAGDAGVDQRLVGVATLVRPLGSSKRRSEVEIAPCTRPARPVTGDRQAVGRQRPGAQSVGPQRGPHRGHLGGGGAKRRRTGGRSGTGDRRAVPGVETAARSARGRPGPAARAPPRRARPCCGDAPAPRGAGRGRRGCARVARSRPATAPARPRARATARARPGSTAQMRTMPSYRRHAPPPQAPRRSLDRSYSGMLPCLRRGPSSRLVCSVCSAVIILGRVSCGMITSSM